MGQRLDGYGPRDLQLVLGLGLGQEILGYHSFQGLPSSAPTGLLTGHEILVASVLSEHFFPI